MAKGGLEIEAVVSWLSVWGLPTFIHTLLPLLLSLVTNKPRRDAAGAGGGAVGGAVGCTAGGQALDGVARKASGVLVALAGEGHLGLAAGMFYIIDPLVACIAAAESPSEAAGAALVIEQVSMRLGEPIVC